MEKRYKIIYLLLLEMGLTEKEEIDRTLTMLADMIDTNDKDSEMILASLEDTVIKVLEA